MKTFVYLCALATLPACQRERIETRRVAKEESAPSQATERATTGGVRWTTPAGWTQLAASAMRVATFRLPQGPGKAEATVVALPGDVGGELANVNRWRGQIALPALNDGQLAANRVIMRSKLGPIAVYDFTGPGANKTRLCAGMLSIEGTMWFFKLMGEIKAVEAAKPEFLRLLKGLTRDGV